MAYFGAAFHGHRGQTCGSSRQLKLIRRRVARETTVHLQGTKLGTALPKDAAGKENMKTKERRVACDFRGAGQIVFRQRNERYHVPDLAIERGADFVEDFGKGRSKGNGSKNLLFRFQQVANSAFRVLRLHPNQSHAPWPKRWLCIGLPSLRVVFIVDCA